MLQGEKPGAQSPGEEGCCLSLAVTMATSVLGAPISVLGYDTNGWEGVWGVVRKDDLEEGPLRVQGKAAGLPLSPETRQPICPSLGVAAGIRAG